MMDIQKLPLEMEKTIFSYAFGIDVAFLIKESIKDRYYIMTFALEHSSFMRNRIDWFNYFMSMIQSIHSIQKDSTLHAAEAQTFLRNINNNLYDFLLLVEKRKLIIDIGMLRGFYQSTRMFGGDNYYEYMLDKIPDVEKILERL